MHPCYCLLWEVNGPWATLFSSFDDPKAYVHTQQQFPYQAPWPPWLPFPGASLLCDLGGILCPSLETVPQEKSLEWCPWSPFFWCNHSWTSDVRAPGWINVRSLPIQVRKLWAPCLEARIRAYKPKTHDESSDWGTSPRLSPSSGSVVLGSETPSLLWGEPERPGIVRSPLRSSCF